MKLSTNLQNVPENRVYSVTALLLSAGLFQHLAVVGLGETNIIGLAVTPHAIFGVEIASHTNIKYY